MPTEFKYPPDFLLNTLAQQARTGGLPSPDAERGNGPFHERSSWERQCERVKAMLIGDHNYDPQLADELIQQHSAGVRLYDEQAESQTA